MPGVFLINLSNPRDKTNRPPLTALAGEQVSCWGLSRSIILFIVSPSRQCRDGRDDPLLGSFPQGLPPPIRGFMSGIATLDDVIARIPEKRGMIVAMRKRENHKKGELREYFLDIFSVHYPCKLYQVTFHENSDSVITKSYSIC